MNESPRSRVGVDVLPTRSPVWPWRAKITVYNEDGTIAGVRSLRARDEADAWRQAESLLGAVRAREAARKGPQSAQGAQQSDDAPAETGAPSEH